MPPVSKPPSASVEKTTPGPSRASSSKKIGKRRSSIIQAKIRNLDPILALHEATIASSKLALNDLQEAMLLSQEASKKAGKNSTLDPVISILVSSIRSLDQSIRSSSIPTDKSSLELHEASIAASSKACKSLQKTLALALTARSAAAGFDQTEDVNLGYRLRLKPMIQTLGAAINNITVTSKMAVAVSAASRRAVTELLSDSSVFE